MATWFFSFQKQLLYSRFLLIHIHYLTDACREVFCVVFFLQHSPSVSTPGGLLGAVLRVEVLLGVGASGWDVGVLDLDTGVVDFSF